MPKCEMCGTELSDKNNSPSEIHSRCFTCWISTKEAESMRTRFELRMKQLR